MKIQYNYEIDGEYFSGLQKAENYLDGLNITTDSIKLISECEKGNKQFTYKYWGNPHIYIVTRHKLNKDYGV